VPDSHTKSIDTTLLPASVDEVIFDGEFERPVSIFFTISNLDPNPLNTLDVIKMVKGATNNPNGRVVIDTVASAKLTPIAGPDGNHFGVIQNEPIRRLRFLASSVTGADFVNVTVNVIEAQLNG
jgi:hypothetical protein